ncbi:DUF348 domain-containing protein [Clostridium sp. 19966]|uniref:3D domain-containing protein n=1 Tax=Clostridium sp. 19966 TaxID=2768166 RepID=UPI0028DF80F4|nr:3D domain-containing protein [Clostridium sp. 19966]MDT8717274.1 DUF348 domain-containing protein [Clostridium sp. 19966]
MEKIRTEMRKFFSVGPKSTFVILLLIIICFSIIHNMKKEITIVIDGKETKIITYTSDLKSSLAKNNIQIGPKDKIQPGIDSKIKNGDRISIKRAVNIKVKVDGKILNVATAQNKVGDMLAAEGIKLSSADKIAPLKTENVTAGMEICITRVSSEIKKNVVSVDYSTVVNKDNNLPSNVTKVVQDGQFGEREITSRLVYEDGKLISNDVISDNVTKQPSQKIIVQGTLGVLNLSRGGEQVLFKRTVRVKATAYTNCYQCTGKSRGSAEYGITSTGTTAKRDPSGYSTIAVDPDVIPLGTKVYVDGYGFAIAEDTGGAIKGNSIDVFLNSYNEASNWGVRYLNVYVLK